MEGQVPKITAIDKNKKWHDSLILIDFKQIHILLILLG